ncbi:hypothetical protein C497_01710 [Halalkalicoccus jeotgali B3]|uniref:Uncharacterized protein n=1 Tax=Halalkalicoccus jeotgali (strain DSM 18796 / CECT 7217 / JCM 14584 / KCTC 4019 / B3) TaxID=795797 RepID=D8JB15_HALJB|nr:hypothetical protein HacjB3_15541 [Halalkalicoccus jeotgali B3]ELY41436.1 hypothetical protein C497_01710 [Halalkalicoccus jeotgali B3]
MGVMVERDLSVPDAVASLDLLDQSQGVPVVLPDLLDLENQFHLAKLANPVERDPPIYACGVFVTALEQDMEQVPAGTFYFQSVRTSLRRVLLLPPEITPESVVKYL